MDRLQIVQNWIVITKVHILIYIDKHVQAFIPNKETDGELNELVNMYQRHSHSKSCRKYKNVQSRFHFGTFFTDYKNNCC